MYIDHCVCVNVYFGRQCCCATEMLSGRLAPLLIQKGRAHAGQKVQPRRVGQDSALDSSTALGKGDLRDRDR
jgi:hypothetical protein